MVATARHGAAALDLLSQRPADIILLDLRMPIMDGWSFVERYRSTVGGKTTPIVIISAVANLEEIARQLHVDGALQKPFGLEEIERTIERFTRGRTLDA